MRIALIHIAQETNDFNPVPTTLDDYRAFGIDERADVLANAGAQSEVAGWMAARDTQTIRRQYGRRSRRHNQTKGNLRARQLRDWCV
jgi:hypothetical protein